jgi:predicted MPP superfamily phosphohydrolase
MPSEISRLRSIRTRMGALIEPLLRKFLAPVYTSPMEIDIQELELILPNLDPDFDRFRFLQIGDIHLGTWVTPTRLNQIVKIIQQQIVDIVVITGDFVSHDIDRNRSALLEALSELRKTKPVFAVLGNHDHWAGAKKIRSILKQSKVLELRNEVYSLQRDGYSLHFVGIDDIWEKQDNLEQILDSLPPSGCAILLSHEPDFADTSAPTQRFDLQISGHSHGGQMILPLLGPLIRVRGARKYPLGLYKIGTMYLYTNRGLGTSSVPIRINCPPEITVYTLRSRR